MTSSWPDPSGHADSNEPGLCDLIRRQHVRPPNSMRSTRLARGRRVLMIYGFRRLCSLGCTTACGALCTTRCHRLVQDQRPGLVRGRAVADHTRSAHQDTARSVKGSPAVIRHSGVHHSGTAIHPSRVADGLKRIAPRVASCNPMAVVHDSWRPAG